jgi:hypothetical protein
MDFSTNHSVLHCNGSIALSDETMLQCNDKLPRGQPPHKAPERAI